MCLICYGPHGIVSLPYFLLYAVSSSWTLPCFPIYSCFLIAFSFWVVQHFITHLNDRWISCSMWTWYITYVFVGMCAHLRCTEAVWLLFPPYVSIGFIWNNSKMNSQEDVPPLLLQSYMNRVFVRNSSL